MNPTETHNQSAADAAAVFAMTERFEIVRYYLRGGAACPRIECKRVANFVARAVAIIVEEDGERFIVIEGARAPVAGRLRVWRVEVPESYLQRPTRLYRAILPVVGAGSYIEVGHHANFARHLRQTMRAES